MPEEECEHKDGVMWNPYNHMVQCHRCGEQFVPVSQTTELREIVRFVAGCPQGPTDYVMLSISKAMSNKARALMGET